MSNTAHSLPALTPLNNRNFSFWSKDIKAWLCLKGLWLLISSNEKALVDAKDKPADPEKVAEWKRNAQKAAGVLLLSVEEQFRGILDSIEENSIAIWAMQSSEFNKKSAGLHFNVMKDLFLVKRHEEELLQSLVHCVDKAMHVLKNLQDSDFDIKKQDEELTCMALFWALHVEYNTFQSLLSLMDMSLESGLT